MSTMSALATKPYYHASRNAVTRLHLVSPMVLPCFVYYITDKSGRFERESERFVHAAYDKRLAEKMVCVIVVDACRETCREDCTIDSVECIGGSQLVDDPILKSSIRDTLNLTEGIITIVDPDNHAEITAWYQRGGKIIIQGVGLNSVNVFTVNR